MSVRVRIAIGCFIIAAWGSKSAAQGILTQPISGNFHEIALVEFLEILENRFDAAFYYEPTRMPFYKQSFTFTQTPLYEALEKFLEGSTLDVVKYGDAIILTNKLTATRESIEELIQQWEDGTLTKPISYEALEQELLIGDSLQPLGGTLTLSGIITDKYSGEPIVGAVIQDQQTGLGTATEESGGYQLELRAGSYRLTISYLGYQSIDLQLGLFSSGTHDVQLQVNALNLSEVVVEASAVQNKVAETQIGVEAIGIREIRDIPAFLGETDVLKSLEQLPGVATAGEASSGFNVRGGNTDQNLIILDEALLFNASHALGFFSIFNSDAVRNVSLYKGSMPARFGGRLSSVLEVNLKEGNLKRWHGRGGVGIASARLVLDGPITSQTGVVIGVRSSYSNWLLNAIKKSTVRNSRVYFGDAMVKITQALGDKHSINLLGYGSYDSFEFNQEFGYNWSTLLGSLKWRYLISNNKTLVTSVVRGLYDSNQFVPTGENAFELSNGISYWKFRSNFAWQTDPHFFNMGFEVHALDMDPEQVLPFNALSGVKPKIIPKDHAIEFAAYLDDDFTLSPSFSISAGLRMVYFASVGPGLVRTYDPELARSPQSVTGTTTIRDRQIIESYSALEPRISMNYKLDESSAIKVAYNRINQFVHLMSGTASSTPVDIWQLSNAHFAGQKSNSYSAGYFWNASEKMEYALEGFYKHIQDFPQFRDLASLLLNEQIETQVVFGSGRSYGVEFSAQKKVGKWTGSLGYAYSRSQARTHSDFPEEIINGNNWYFTPFDQPHQLNLQFKRSPNPVQHLNISFVFKTGRAVTAPVANYDVQGILITHYADRNTFRIPAYHRLDIGYTIDKSESKLKGFTSSFTASFYNFYGRRNAYSIYFKRDQNTVQRAFKLSVLGSIFPSLTWNLTF